MTSSPIPALDAIPDARLKAIVGDDYRNKDTLIMWRGDPISKREVVAICQALLDLRANHTARADVAEDYVLRLETIIRESCKQLNSIIEDGRPTDWRAWLADLEAVLAASPSQGDSA